MLSRYLWDIVLQRGPEYRGLVTASWDLLRGDTSSWPDRDFYLELIRASGQPALDVGCATGRLLLDYRAQGIDIDGVDESAEMLDLCREKAAELGIEVALYQQRMEELRLPRTYATILVPSSSFQLLNRPTDAEQALRRFSDHLQPGGLLVMSFMELWRAGEPLRQERLVEQAKRPADGATIRHWEDSQFEPQEQIARALGRYEIAVGGATTETVHHEYWIRWYTQRQARELYSRNGFGDLSVVREFTRQPAIERNRMFCVIGHKPRPID